jgi:hypothetical protein
MREQYRHRIVVTGIAINDDLPSHVPRLSAWVVVGIPRWAERCIACVVIYSMHQQLV